MSDREKFCDIINKAFEYPFMPKGFVHVSPSPYPNGIRFQIGSRDVSFTLDGEWMGQGTKLPEEWTITKNKSSQRQLCAAEDCNTLFTPTPQGSAQKYCSTRCRNRIAKRRARRNSS